MKTFGIFFICLFLMGCSGNSKQISVEQVKVTENIIETRCNIYQVSEFNFKNHEYFLFESGSGKFATSWGVHNPDCKYCKNDSVK